MTCADSVIVNNKKEKLNDAVNFNSINSYSKSQTQDIHPFISTAKNFEEFEKINNPGRPVDESNKVSRVIMFGRSREKNYLYKTLSIYKEK